MKNYLKILIRLRNRYLMGFDLIGLHSSIGRDDDRLDDVSILDSFSMALLLYSIVMICLKLYAYYGTGLITSSGRMPARRRWWRF